MPKRFKVIKCDENEEPKNRKDKIRNNREKQKSRQKKTGLS